MRALEFKTCSSLVFELLIVAMVGCESTGSGMGESATGYVHANFTWHVLANLTGADGKRMRFKFHLLRAAEGMKGWGRWRCQLPSGKTIKADFSPS